MSLRRNIRNTAKRGSVVYGIVESYNNGLATVKLSEGGSRLSNLSTVGGIVTVGDKVVVDYSAGITPVIRPLFIREPDPEELGLTIAEMYEPKGDNPWFDDEVEIPPPDTWNWVDYGWRAHGSPYGYNENPDPGGSDYVGVQTVPYDEEFQWKWAEYVPSEYVFPYAYDTHNSISLFWPGPVEILIPASGKWIFHAWLQWALNGGVGCVNTNRQAVYSIGIKHNSTVIARVTTRDDEHISQYQVPQMIFAIDDCLAGDTVELFGYQTSMDPLSNGYAFYSCNVGSGWAYYGELWGWVPRDDYQVFVGQLIPGTQS